jgi:hypothetical protein
MRCPRGFLTRFGRWERTILLDFKPPDKRRKSGDERVAMPGPPSGVWELKNLGMPVCLQDGIFHVSQDRAEDRSDNFRPKARNFPSQKIFSILAHCPPQKRIEVIYRFLSQVRQVTAARAKRVKEIFIVDPRVSRLKSRTHGTIQPRVRRVEEASGSRWRLTDKQHLNTLWPERLAQPFTFRYYCHLTTRPAYFKVGTAILFVSTLIESTRRSESCSWLQLAPEIYGFTISN